MMLDLAGSDHDEAPLQTSAARSKAQAATPWTEPLKGGTRLRDVTPKENKTHKQSCQLGNQKCSQCRYWDLIDGAGPPVCHEEPRPAEGYPEGGGACQVALAGFQT